MSDNDIGVSLFDWMDRRGLNWLVPVEHQPATARQAFFRTCRDGWVIAYTTGRISGGPDHGKFAVLAYKPIGAGSRSGRRGAQQWELAYSRAFARRHLARSRAEVLFSRHDAAGRVSAR